MGVTSGSEAAWGARSADVLVEGLELTVHIMGRLRGGAVGLVTGGRLCGVKTGDPTHTGVRDSIREVLGAAGKAGLASTAAVTDALGCKRPPPAPFVGGPEMSFNLKQGREAAAAAGAGQSGARLLIPPAMPGTGEGVGAEGSGGLAHRPALPDTGGGSGGQQGERG